MRFKRRARLGRVARSQELTGQDLVPEDHPFGPPAERQRCGCIHCGRVYSSDEMRRREDGLWGCKFTDCDGAGFGMDIVGLDDEAELSYFRQSFGGA